MTCELCVMVPAAEAGAALETAKRLGWKGLCLLADSKESRAAKEAVTKARVKGIEVSIGLLLEPKSKNELKRRVSASRKNCGLIAVKPNSPELSRSAAETRGVDLLIGWESVGQSPTERVIDYVTIKIAAGNGVAIAFSLQPLLAAYDRSRASVMSKYIETARFVRKYKAGFALTSGAVSAWDLRSPSELAAFGKVLGFNGREARQALSGGLLEENRKRLSGKWIMPGVEVE